MKTFWISFASETGNPGVCIVDAVSPESALGATTHTWGVQGCSTFLWESLFVFCFLFVFLLFPSCAYDLSSLPQRHRRSTRGRCPKSEA